MGGLSWRSEVSVNVIEDILKPLSAKQSLLLLPIISTFDSLHEPHELPNLKLSVMNGGRFKSHLGT
jgi:hypothetical protein